MTLVERITEAVVKLFDKELADSIYEFLVKSNRRQLIARELPVEWVEKYAKLDFQAVRDQLSGKIEGKMALAFGTRSDTCQSIRVFLQERIPVEAVVRVTLDERNEVSIVLNQKWNYRSTCGFYAQYPLRVSHLLVDGEEISQPSLQNVATAFRGGKASTREVPEIEPTYTNLKALVGLTYDLQCKTDLEKAAQKRALRGYTWGTRGPQAAITRNCNKLQLPKDLTAEEALDLLVASLPLDVNERLIELVTYRFVKRAKRGSRTAEIDKLLKKLELTRTQYSGNDDGYELSGLGRRVTRWLQIESVTSNPDTE